MTFDPQHSPLPTPNAHDGSTGRLPSLGRWGLGVGSCLRLLLVLAAVTSGACAARGGVPRPFPGAALPPSAETAGAPDTAVVPVPMTVQAVLSTALTLRGVPYVNGGTDPSGFDCSGFVQWVFAQHGTALPREVRAQYRVGEEVGFDELRPGDLVFFETVSRGASHVGIALGGGEFVHAPSSRGVVRVERFTIPYWETRYLGARRVTSPGASTD